MSIIKDSQGRLICPFLYPYLDLLVNSCLQTTYLSVTTIPPTYDFGDIKLPHYISLQKVSASVYLHFNTSFNILQNTNDILDINTDVHEINTPLLSWEAVWDTASGQYAPGGDFTCVRSEPNTSAASTTPAASVDPPCAFSQYKPGFWNRSSHTFLPAGCAYVAQSLPLRPAPHRWFHLVGDSNMRKLHVAICHHHGAHRRSDHGQDQRKPPLWSICFASDNATAFVYSASWMIGDMPVYIDEPPLLVGRNLSGALCSIAPSRALGVVTRATLCQGSWNIIAERTVVLVGSHKPQQKIPTARADVQTWLDNIVRRLPRTGTLSAVLVTAVCVGQFAVWRQHAGQLFQRNNYRIRGVNDATVAALTERGVPWVDAFSVTLAAGCAEESADVVHFREAAYVAVAGLLLSHLAGLDSRDSGNG